MAETIASTGTGINTSGLRSADVSPTVGTAGRVSAPGLDLRVADQALNRVADGMQRGAASRAAAAEKADQNSYFREGTELEQALLNDAPAGQLSNLVLGLREDGMDTPQNRAALLRAEDLAKRYESARAAGKPEIAARMLFIEQQRRLLSEHPHLGPEIAALSERSFNQTVGLTSEEAQAERKALQAASAARIALGSAADPNFLKLTKPEQDAVVGRETALNQQVVDLDRQVKMIKGAADVAQGSGQNGSTNTPQLQKLAFDNYGTYLNVGVKRMLAAATAATDPVTRRAASIGALLQWQASLQQTYSPTVYNTVFKDAYDKLVSTVESTANNQYAVEAIRTKVNGIIATADNDLLAGHPGAARAYVLSNRWGELLKPTLAAPDIQQQLGSWIMASGEGDAQTIQNQIGVRIQSDSIFDPRGAKQGNMETSALVAGSAEVSKTAIKGYNDPIFATEQGKVGIYQAAMGYLKPEVANRDPSIVRNALTVMSDPRWIEAQGDRPVNEDARDSVMMWMDKLNTDTATLFEREAGNIVTTFDVDSGKVAFKQKVYNRATSDTLRKIEADVNLTIRASAHMYGRTDYLPAFQQMQQERQQIIADQTVDLSAAADPKRADGRLSPVVRK